jgi:hypothetical protein
LFNPEPAATVNCSQPSFPISFSPEPTATGNRSQSSYPDSFIRRRDGSFHSLF